MKNTLKKIAKRHNFPIKKISSSNAKSFDNPLDENKRLYSEMSNVTIQPMYGCQVAEPGSYRYSKSRTDIVRREIMDRLNEETRLTQIPDLGSIIGETVAKWAKHTPEEIDDFVDSFSHGVSMATGTHDRNEANEFIYIKKYYVDKMVRSEKLDAIFYSTLWGMVAGGLLMAAIFVFG